MNSLSAKIARISFGKYTSWKLGPLWLALPGVVFLAVFLLFPSAKVIGLSFIRADGTFTFSAFSRFFGPSVYRQVLLNTFSIALESTFLCLFFAYPLAYWLSGLKKQHQQILSLLVLLSFWSSSLVKNFAWLVLLGRGGPIEQLMHFIGVNGVHFLFNRAIVVFAITHTLLPLAVVTMLPVMNQIDRRLPLAAATLGADRAQVFWRIFFIQSIRGVAAAGLLVFISSLGYFITPTLLGSPREMMLGQLIIVQINELQNWQLGSALAVVLVITALISCLIYDLVFGLSSLANSGDAAKARHHQHLRSIGVSIVNVVAEGASGIVRAYDAYIRGVLKVDLLSMYSYAVIVLLLFPVVAIIPMAFTAGSFLTFPPQGFSLRWFAEYVDSPLWIGATIRSFGIGMVVAIVTCVFAIFAALGIAKSRSRLKSSVFILFLLPMVIPSLVIAIALFYFCAHISLVATNLGIALGHIVIAMPLVFVILLSTLNGHDWRIDQAASTLGANRIQVLFRSTLPAIRGGLAAAAVIGFLSSFEELTVALFIGGGIKVTLPKQLWDDVLLQVSPTLAAASTIVMVVVIGLFLLAQMARSRSA